MRSLEFIEIMIVSTIVEPISCFMRKKVPLTCGQPASCSRCTHMHLEISLIGFDCVILFFLLSINFYPSSKSIYIGFPDGGCTKWQILLRKVTVQSAERKLADKIADLTPFKALVQDMIPV